MNMHLIIIKKVAIVSMATAFLANFMSVAIFGRARQTGPNIDWDALDNLSHKEAIKIIEDNTIELSLLESVWYQLSSSGFWISVSLIFFCNHVKWFVSCLLGKKKVNKLALKQKPIILSSSF